jgi:hypothetical protein
MSWAAKMMWQVVVEHARNRARAPDFSFVQATKTVALALMLRQQSQVRALPHVRCTGSGQVPKRYVRHQMIAQQLVMLASVVSVSLAPMIRTSGTKKEILAANGWAMIANRLWRSSITCHLVQTIS